MIEPFGEVARKTLLIGESRMYHYRRGWIPKWVRGESPTGRSGFSSSCSHEIIYGEHSSEASQGGEAGRRLMACASRLISRWAFMDVVNENPEQLEPGDLVRQQRDWVVDDAGVWAQVGIELAQCYWKMPCHGWPSTAVKVLLQLMRVRRPGRWRYRMAD